MTYALVILSWSNTENTKAKAKQREMYFNIYFGGDIISEQFSSN